MDEKTILKKSRRRKPSPTPRMVAVAVRLPVEVARYYRTNYPSYTSTLREIILDHFGVAIRYVPLPPLDTVKE
jgi:hypothetical protein